MISCNIIRLSNDIWFELCLRILKVLSSVVSKSAAVWSLTNLVKWNVCVLTDHYQTSILIKKKEFALCLWWLNFIDHLSLVLLPMCKLTSILCGYFFFHGFLYSVLGCNYLTWGRCAMHHNILPPCCRLFGWVKKC